MTSMSFYPSSSKDSRDARAHTNVVLDRVERTAARTMQHEYRFKEKVAYLRVIESSLLEKNMALCVEEFRSISPSHQNKVKASKRRQLPNTSLKPYRSPGGDGSEVQSARRTARREADVWWHAPPRVPTVGFSELRPFRPGALTLLSGRRSSAEQTNRKIGREKREE
ncbi:hypothetical protein BDV96DRAFT_630040 [Lophiotrema nucula]|uniref:Uncharacterized protein n=1 Tax=Lophiotrema nucula TaxID=690887 RepID=A0A6A5ZJD4_9PLEO|nr:hypothetical protein BDV96DRAFT_630040 [Lophiotrema nucula]